MTKVENDWDRIELLNQLSRAEKRGQGARLTADDVVTVHAALAASPPKVKSDAFVMPTGLANNRTWGERPAPVESDHSGIVEVNEDDFDPAQLRAPVESDDGDISDEQFAALKASVTVPPLIPVESRVVELPDDDEPKTWRDLAEAAIADLRHYADDELPYRRLVSAEAYEERFALLALATSGVVTEAMIEAGVIYISNGGSNIRDLDWPNYAREIYLAMCAAR